MRRKLKKKEDMYQLSHKYKRTAVLWMLIGIIYFSNQTALRAQFYTIPDITFRNYLSTTYPGILNGSNDLIISNAAAIEGPFSITSGVTNVDGVQYFTAVDSIYCFSNNIPSMPFISSMTDLKVIQVGNSNLTVLPTNLNQLTSLKNLIIETNKLTIVPSLKGLTNLKEIEFCHNFISLDN